MSGTLLVDANVPQEVCARLNDIGFNAIYLTDIWSGDAKDGKILDWMEAHEVPIITRDKSFPEDGRDRKIVIDSESPVKLTRRAVRELLTRNIYPSPLLESWKGNGERHLEPEVENMKRTLMDELGLTRRDIDEAMRNYDGRQGSKHRRKDPF